MGSKTRKPNGFEDPKVQLGHTVRLFGFGELLFFLRHDYIHQLAQKKHPRESNWATPSGFFW